MIYKIISQTDDGTVFGRIDDDGLCRVTCTENNPEFQAYIKSGAELLGADGQVMDAIQFVKELP
jgi:hypothetical protein